MKNNSCQKIAADTLFLFVAGIMSSGLVSAATGDGDVANRTESASCFIPDYYLPLVLLVVLIVFGILLALGYRTNRDLDHGEMRRTIAGTLIFGFTAIVFLSLKYDFRNEDLINSYIQLVGVVIGFYFGTRAVMEKQERGDFLSVENVRFESEGSGRKISVFIRNKSSSDITIDKIDLAEKDYDIDLRIKPGKAEKKILEPDGGWEAGKTYRVRVATTDGKTAEEVFVAPGGGQDARNTKV
jgi:hypothetical protein